MQSQSCNSHNMFLCRLCIRAISRINVTIIMPTHTLSLSYYILLTQLLFRAQIQCLADLVFGVWRVRHIRQSRLPLAHVPVQTLGQAFEPVVYQVMATDGGHRVTGCSNLDTVGKKHRRKINPTKKKIDRMKQQLTMTVTRTSLHIGSPVSSCHQTTPKQCSWRQETRWSVWR